MQQIGQRAAFPGACLIECIKTLIEQGQRLWFEAIAAVLAPLQYPGKGKNAGDIHRCRVVYQIADSACSGGQLLNQRFIQGQGAVAALQLVAQGELNLAAAEVRATALAQRPFQAAQGIGQAWGHFEIAVVDRFQFPDQGGLSAALFDPGKRGHAVNHAAPARQKGQSTPLAGGPAVGCYNGRPYQEECLMRPSGRQPDQLREIQFTRQFTRYAEGSVLVEFGHTRVLCTASVEENVPRFLKGKGKGWVTAEYGMLPRSTHSRNQREASSGKQGGRTVEIQRLIGRSLRAAVDLKKLGEHTITLDCDVLQADGGTRTASISGACVALVDALSYLLEKKRIKDDPLQALVASVSVGIYKGQPVLDLDYPEDSAADTDMNVVMNQHGGIIELQGTAEAAPFTREQQNTMLGLAEQGIADIVTLQQQVLGW